MGVTTAAPPSTLLTSMLPGTSATTFPRFGQLPTELQIMIFEHAAALPQSIDLHSGITQDALLSACHLSRSLPRAYTITYEGRIGNRFRVSYDPSKDYLDMTAQFRPSMLRIPSMMATLAQLANSMSEVNRYQSLLEDSFRSMAWINARCCSVLDLITRHDHGRGFMASLAKLRMDFKALTLPIDPEAVENEKDDWCDLWEWVLDNCEGVGEIEMRLVSRNKSVQSWICEKKAKNPEPKAVKVGVWEWVPSYEAYERVDCPQKEKFGNSCTWTELENLEDVCEDSVSAYSHVSETSKHESDGRMNEEVSEDWTGFDLNERVTIKALLWGAEEAQDLVRSDLEDDEIDEGDDEPRWTLPMPRIVVTRILE